MIVSGSLMTIITIVLGTVLTLVTIKVKKLVWQTDKIIPMMLIMMCCCLYAQTLFFLFYNILVPTIVFNKLCAIPEPLGVKIVDDYLWLLPAYFLGVGAILNLNKWIYFYMRILAFIKIGRGIHEFGGDDLNQSNS
jgi:hypothetical protein